MNFILKNSNHGILAFTHYFAYNVNTMSDSIQKIKDKLNILDVVSPYVELHKAGKNFKGKSPFSAEKTPSFYVSPDRGMYYCFSTSQGGDIFNFIEAMEGVDFKGALTILAEKAGVELVPEDPKKKSERDRLYMALEDATKFYSERLLNQPEAMSYLEQRGVRSETVAKWRIGFAPGPPQYGWRETKDYLGSLGYSNDELIKSGLIKNANSGKEPFDVFRDRIMFPLFESSGKVVAFSGRILSKDTEAPKYVNSPETILFKKSELLYGYDKAKTGIRNLDFSLIVEGQFDVVMSHQAGYSNTVAVSGTALTSHHVQLLERLSDKVVLALDADRAGINAMKKAADVMLRRGLDVKVAELPMGKDPADLIQEDVTEFKKIVGKSVHVIEFILHVLRREITDNRSFKLKVREEVLPFILLLPNRIDQEHFVSKVAESINTSTDAVRYELDHLRREGSGGVILVEKKDSNKPTYSGSLLESTYVFILAVAEVQAELKNYLYGEIEKFEKFLDMPIVDPSTVAKTTFEISDAFAHKKELEIYEEIINQLNHLRREVAKMRLSLLRTEQEDIFENKDAVDILRQCEEMRKNDIYNVDLLINQKD